MRKPHFFNLYSNLGVRKLWRGVECDMQAMRNAPQYFWDDDFKNKFPKAKIDNFICHDSAEVKDWNDYLSKYVANVQAISELIENKLQTKETSVVIGGDHSIALPNILANLQRVDSTEKFGVLIFDSHEDFMQSEISRATSTGNFHGMWLRPLFDKFDEPVLDNLVPHKLPLSNLFYVGNLDIEDEPKDFFAKHRVKLLSEKNFNLDFEKSIQALQSYVANLDHLHLSFDMDVFLGDDLAVNLPHENGMSINMVMKILDEIKLPNSLSVDLVELNSSRGNFEQTKKLAQDVLLKILNKNSSSMGYNVDD